MWWWTCSRSSFRDAPPELGFTRVRLCHFVQVGNSRLGWRRPGIHNHDRECGFRTRADARPGMTTEGFALAMTGLSMPPSSVASAHHALFGRLTTDRALEGILHDHRHHRIRRDRQRLRTDACSRRHRSDHFEQPWPGFAQRACSRTHPLDQGRTARHKRELPQNPSLASLSGYEECIEPLQAIPSSGERGSTQAPDVFRSSMQRPVAMRRPYIFHYVALLSSNHREVWITVANLT
jgi:hypothetical protein